MKYKSEITGIEYNTEKECLDAEARYCAATQNALRSSELEHIYAQDAKARDLVKEYQDTVIAQTRRVNEARETAKAAIEESYKTTMRELGKLDDMIDNYEKTYGVEIDWSGRTDRPVSKARDTEVAQGFIDRMLDWFN